MKAFVFGLFLAAFQALCKSSPLGLFVPIDVSLAPPTTATRGSTTSASTTLSPTILASTTAAPTSVGSTTSVPSSLGSTTSAPTTSVSTTSDPTKTSSSTPSGTTTVNPTTSGSTTLNPTTSDSTTAGPTTSSSTTLAPRTLSPTTPIRTQPPTQGYVLVSLVVYSGLVDPKWQVPLSVFSASDYQSIQTHGLSPACIPARLGYKGFLIQVSGGELLIVGRDVETVRLQILLFQTMPRSAIPSILQQRVAQEIGTVSPECLTVRRKRHAPAYDPARWNVNAVTRRKNNCYNYANDKITNSFAQPGKGGGQIYNQLKIQEVFDAAVRDGLAPALAAGEASPPDGPRHLVALFLDEDIDFHWYRLDQGGLWSHKPGQTRATRLDNGGNNIDDPRVANTGNYRFVAFMTTDTNAVTIE